MEEEKVSPGGPSTNPGPLLDSSGYSNLWMLPASLYLACLQCLLRDGFGGNTIQITSELKPLETHDRNQPNKISEFVGFPPIAREA